MKIIFHFFLGCFCIAFLLTAQPALNSLKKNLRLLYSADINTKEPGISELKISTIAVSKSAVIFYGNHNDCIKLSTRVLTGATTVKMGLTQ